MRFRKLLAISFGVTALYVGLSLLYTFHGSLWNIPLALELFLRLPAVVIFLFGYGAGDSAPFVGATLLFAIIWMFITALLSLFIRKPRLKQ